MIDYVGGQTVSATAGGDGVDSPRLAPMKATATGQDFLVSGSTAIKIADALVGDVWLCSGQSNMYYGMLDYLTRFPIKGVAWYQGESNGDDGPSYTHKLRR